MPNDTYLTIKEAAENYGKAEITIRRFGPQPNRYPRAIQTSETTPCVFLRSAGKARYASYPHLDVLEQLWLDKLKPYGAQGYNRSS